SKLTEWILDEASNTLYGISKDDKALFFMNAKTLNIEKSISFTSNPTDIIKDGSNLYIALDDINQIAVVDMATRKTTKTLYTSSDPYRIVKNGDKLYYTERDQWCNIYEYDVVKNIDKILPIGTLYNPDLAINKEKNILYIGESGLSGSNMVYYSITDNKIISKSNYNNGYGFSYPERSILFDGINVFYAGRNFKDDNATTILGKYSDDTIIYTTDEFVFTKKSIYNKKDYSLISNFDFELNLAAQSSKYDMYFYNEQNKVVLKVEPDTTAPVVEGVKNEGIYYANVTIRFNEGTGTLDGKAFTSGDKVTAIGLHTLEVVDDSGNITVVRFTISDYKKEDVNKDGIVDMIDMSMVSIDYDKTNKDSNWNDSLDINTDGIIDIFDIVLVSKNIE
ncbi:MAG: dockerin type I domain-containing protein, partial [Clostridium sp.]